MIYDLLLTLAMLQPVYWEQDVMLWGGRNTRAFNQDGGGLEVTHWPDVGQWFVAVGWRGKWLRCFRIF